MNPSAELQFRQDQRQERTRAVSRSDEAMVAVGFSPRTADRQTVKRRGATRETHEPSDTTMAFNRRAATARVCLVCNRGLKPTATLNASLREAASALHRFGRGIRAQNSKNYPSPERSRRSSAPYQFLWLKAVVKVSGAENLVGSLCRNLCRIGHFSTKASTKFATKMQNQHFRNRLWLGVGSWSQSASEFHR